MSIFGPVAAWYVVVQLCTVIVLPLSLVYFRALPDRGYAPAKVLGILLVGYSLWLGVALGLLRNEPGGAWLAFLLVAGVSFAVAWNRRADLRTWWARPGMRGHVLTVEILFAAAFGLWAIVRAYDPAANHTEQPMDLMFLNSIWGSPAYPPQDAWLAGYAIAYYYFGYWLLATLGRLAGTAPEITYNVGQAAWFGLLLVSCYGVGYNLLAFRVENDADSARDAVPAGWLRSSRIGGLCAAAGVALAGNLQGVMEWLYANGAPVEGIARLLGVHNFPDNARVTGNWYISLDWWWWRTSRVIHDRTLLGEHREVIDEFPMFSYVLGDNHPHVLAMPVVLVVISLAMNLLFTAYLQGAARSSFIAQDGVEPKGKMGLFERLRLAAGGWTGLALLCLATGSLLFLNTWDFPPYWGLMVLCCGAFLLVTGQAERANWARHNRGWFWGVGLLGIVLLVGTVILYAPYLLTAQSQAGGVVPNFFYPTRIQQFFVMFGAWFPAIALLLWVGVRVMRPSIRVLALSVGAALGAPLALLLLAVAIVFGSDAGQAFLAQTPLPPDATGYGTIMLQRWLSQGFTFLLLGTVLGVVAACIWAGYSSVPRYRENDPNYFPYAAHARLGFALLLAFCGFVLVVVPEVFYLRDQFGWRMNTIFKFYYQAWLLFGLAGTFVVVEQIRRGFPWLPRWGAVPAWASAGLVAMCLVFPFAAVYSKTNGFAASSPTLDATQYVEGHGQSLAAAMQWIREHVPPDAIVLEAKGRSYRADYNRVSAMTGRPTLLGWDGHQSQWRGEAYSRMAAGRAEEIEIIYRSHDPRELRALLDRWGIEYVYLSPVEVLEYEIGEATLAALTAVGEVVFDGEDVRIFRVGTRDY